MTDENKPAKTIPRKTAGPMQQQIRREGPYYSLQRQRNVGSQDAQATIGSVSDESAVQV